MNKTFKIILKILIIIAVFVPLLIFDFEDTPIVIAAAAGWGLGDWAVILMKGIDKL